MKTINFKKSLVMMLIASLFSFNAIADAEKSEQKRTLKKQFAEVAKDVQKQFKSHSSVEVEALIEVDEKGAFSSLKINANDDLLVEEMRQRLSQMSFRPEDQGIYKVIYQFRK